MKDLRRSPCGALQAVRELVKWIRRHMCTQQHKVVAERPESSGYFCVYLVRASHWNLDRQLEQKKAKQQRPDANNGPCKGSNRIDTLG